MDSKGAQLRAVAWRMSNGCQTARALADDSADPFAERSEKPLDGAGRALLERAAVDGTQLRRDAIARLEVLGVHGTFRDRPPVRLAAQLHGIQPIRHHEISARQ